MPSTLPAITLALVALAATAAASENLLDPFPSLRSVGDTVYTKFSAVITNVTGNGTKANVAGNWEDMPAALKDYVNFLEKELSVPVRLLSFGPDRVQTILR